MGRQRCLASWITLKVNTKGWLQGTDKKRWKYNETDEGSRAPKIVRNKLGVVFLWFSIEWHLFKNLSLLLHWPNQTEKACYTGHIYKEKQKLWLCLDFGRQQNAEICSVPFLSNPSNPSSCLSGTKYF